MRSKKHAFCDMDWYRRMQAFFHQFFHSDERSEGSPMAAVLRGDEDELNESLKKEKKKSYLVNRACLQK